ncbi:hypothetical protein F4810DRAFT_671611 [Camillea tinctor]|nr:hypothetical protein F4810DRAFT_671611 [Camillea tinctor]
MMHHSYFPLSSTCKLDIVLLLHLTRLTSLWTNIIVNNIQTHLYHHRYFCYCLLDKQIINIMDPVKRLTNELCSLLDEATILSITSDYNLQDAKEFAAARQVLLTISKDVEAEEATGFNPSGIGADDLTGTNQSSRGAGRTSGHTESDLKSNDGLTVTTDSSRSESFVSARSSQASSPVNPGIIHVGIFDGLSDEEKESQLVSMFVSLKPIDIKLTLQKCKGDASLAIDELLNLQWLEQTGQRPKGVNGFFVSDDDTAPSKKKKGKKKKTKIAKAAVATPPLRSPSNEGAPEIKSKQEVDLDNITFLCDRLNMSVSEAQEIYQRNSDSLGAAIIEMIQNYIALGIQVPDSEQLPHVKEQAKRVPWIPREYINPVFEISASPQSALDIIDVLAGSIPRPAFVKYNISYSLAASGLELEPVPASSASQQQFVARPPLQLTTTLGSATATTASLAAAKDHSYSAATAAYKRGRSDPLFRAAAGFYAERGRLQAASHRAAARAEADLRVDAQSTPDAVDLHGVTVRDGVEIALERVRRWWDAQREKERGKEKGHGGFTVVTGLGRHSVDGRSRLRVNVFKALVADGWKVQVLTGSYLVTGRVGR